MANSGNTPGEQTPRDDHSGPETSDLAERIKRAQRARAPHGDDASSSRQGDMSTLARGLRIGTEFVAAILVGSFIGFAIDQFAGTGPWALLGFFFLGFAAGILNVTRVVAELNAQSTASDKDPGDKNEKVR
ncbi:AtpZ/AtpI family protein [Pelagibacterium montanilacus]|uniref:AtpZ/AtpI family protein n=1 Tax=Pelagibacterium montanilacus TaxID=2185280 RepID=UPI000F8D92DA|nr:AtpZ/AtpI family protein [Pelagibacterium montanilacus]